MRERKIELPPVGSFLRGPQVRQGQDGVVKEFKLVLHGKQQESNRSPP